jgi:hypothetical protein
VEVGEEVDDFLEIFFNDSTTRNWEPGETVRIRCLQRQGFDCIVHFFSVKSSTRLERLQAGNFIISQLKFCMDSAPSSSLRWSGNELFAMSSCLMTHPGPFHSNDGIFFFFAHWFSHGSILYSHFLLSS